MLGKEATPKGVQRESEQTKESQNKLYAYPQISKNQKIDLIHTLLSERPRKSHNFQFTIYK